MGQAASTSDQIGVIDSAIACGVRDWWAFAGDPLISGSVFMTSYAVTAWMILRVAVRLSGSERTYWNICGWLFVFQFINVNADLHGMIFTVGRCLAHAQGWYGQRREVQLEVLVGLAAIAGLIILTILLLYFRSIFGNLLLSLGVLTALGLTLAKGVNYHNLEQLYAGVFGFFRGADLIELGGIAMALSAAIWRTTELRGMRSAVG